jgi:hypothetical protein
MSYLRLPRHLDSHWFLISNQWCLLNSSLGYWTKCELPIYRQISSPKQFHGGGCTGGNQVLTYWTVPMFLGPEPYYILWNLFKRSVRGVHRRVTRSEATARMRKSQTCLHGCYDQDNPNLIEVLVLKIPSWDWSLSWRASWEPRRLAHGCNEVCPQWLLNARCMYYLSLTDLDVHEQTWMPIKPNIRLQADTHDMKAYFPVKLSVFPTSVT